jgi:hypothetical protein
MTDFLGGAVFQSVRDSDTVDETRPALDLNLIDGVICQRDCTRVIQTCGHTIQAFCDREHHLASQICRISMYSKVSK